MAGAKVPFAPESVSIGVHRWSSYFLVPAQGVRHGFLKLSAEVGRVCPYRAVGHPLIEHGELSRGAPCLRIVRSASVSTGVAQVLNLLYRRHAVG